MKRATKDRIVLFVLYGVASLGIASIVYGVDLYFFEIADPLTPYGMWAFGVGLLVFTGVGIGILSQKKKKHNKN